MKNREIDWFRIITKPSFTKFFVYIVAFSFLLIFLSDPWDFFTRGITNSNGLYLLSAIMQSLATVLALVVTLTMVAVQMSSTSFSIKVTSIFLRKSFFWALIGVYTFLIGSCILLLSDIDYYSTTGQDILEAVILFSIAAFFYLFYYTYSILELLSPKGIVKEFVTEIDLKTIFDYSKKDKSDINPSKGDPLHNINYITYKKIREKDIETVQELFSQLSSRCSKIIGDIDKKCPNQEFFFSLENENLSRESTIRNTFNYFLVYFRNIERIALKNNEEQVIVEIIKSYRDLAIESLKCRLTENFRRDNQITFSFIYEIENITRECIQKEFWDCVNQSFSVFSIISKESTKYNLSRIQEYSFKTLLKLSKESRDSATGFSKIFITKSSIANLRLSIQGLLELHHNEDRSANQITHLNYFVLSLLELKMHNEEFILANYEKLISLAWIDVLLNNKEEPDEIFHSIARVYQIHDIDLVSVWRNAIQNGHKVLEDLKSGQPERQINEKKYYDLLNGLKEIFGKSTELKNGVMLSTIIDSFYEMSRIPIYFEIEEKVIEIVSDMEWFFEKLEDQRQDHIYKKIFSIGYLCIHKNLDTCSKEIAETLDKMALMALNKPKFPEHSKNITNYLGCLGVIALAENKRELTTFIVEKLNDFDSMYRIKIGKEPERSFEDFIKQSHASFMVRSMEEFLFDSDEQYWLHWTSSDNDTPKFEISDDMIEKFLEIYTKKRAN